MTQAAIVVGTGTMQSLALLLLSPIRIRSMLYCETASALLELTIYVCTLLLLLLPASYR